MEEPEMTLHERLSALEATCAKQTAQIDGLVGVVSDLLAANVVLHKDLRLCSFIREDIDGDMRREREGGTSHFSASYLGARADLWGKVLQETANSRVFEQYWFRSIFWRKEERQRAWLEKLRKAVELKLEF